MSPTFLMFLTALAAITTGMIAPQRKSATPPPAPVPVSVSVPINPPSPAAGLEPPWFVWADREVGFHERGDNLGIEKYVALAHCGSPGQPWCAIFLNSAIEVSGLKGTRSAMARSFEHDPNFVKLDGPAIGAITTMWRGSPSSGSGHVFLYAGENDNGILALGGNQSNEVCRQYEPRNRIVGYYWPRSASLPHVGKVIVTDKTGHRKIGSET